MPIDSDKLYPPEPMHMKKVREFKRQIEKTGDFVEYPPPRKEINGKGKTSSQARS